jgi:hypothetical protein
MTIALSPASTRSIKMMASKADHQGEENSSIQTLHSSSDMKIRARIFWLDETEQGFVGKYSRQDKCGCERFDKNLFRL